MSERFCFKNALGEEAKDKDFLFAQGDITSVDLKPASGGALRRFDGIAYTGNVIRNHYYWGNVAFDISGMDVPAKMAILLNHETGKIVGHADKSEKIEAGLRIEGFLSKTTDHGKEVAALSDEGFPWQMSVRIQPSKIEQVEPGNTAFVNGREVQGPVYIFRESKLTETSFTPTGWDAGTSATALSLSQTATNEEEDNRMSQEKIQELTASLEVANGKLAEATAKIEAMSNELNTMKEAAVTAEKAERVNKLKTAYANLKLEMPAEMSAMAESMSNDSLGVMITAMEQAAKTRLPEGLFSDTAHGPNGSQDNKTKPADHETSLLAVCEAASTSFSQSHKG